MVHLGRSTIFPLRIKIIWYGYMVHLGRSTIFPLRIMIIWYGYMVHLCMTGDERQRVSIWTGITMAKADVPLKQQKHRSHWYQPLVHSGRCTTKTAKIPISLVPLSGTSVHEDRYFKPLQHLDFNPFSIFRKRVDMEIKRALSI